MQEPTFLMLTALAAESLHGYGLIQEVATLSLDRVRLRAGTVYGALDRLQEDGLVEVEREEVVEGRLRRYYRLTSDGSATLAAAADRMKRTAALAEKRLASRATETRPGRPIARPATGSI
ncbi:PadR family transcriptional regulator [Fodinicola feengrottensis]|nr:PadR family transcriptional regulator [Fodinicola feengrottensis]